MSKYTEEYFKNCDEKTITDLYYHQYDEEREIPPIDQIYEEGSTVYKIYCYENTDKYFCKVFENPEEL